MAFIVSVCLSSCNVVTSLLILLARLSGGDFERVYPLIRKTAAEMGVEVQVLGDLQGPKFRVGELADGPITIGWDP